MYKELSEDSRRVMQLANQEAQRFEQDYISTGHLLLGILRVNGNIGYQVLVERGFDLKVGRQALDEIEPTGNVMVTMGKLNKTAESKESLDYAKKVSFYYYSPLILPEEIFLGILNETNSVCNMMLGSRGLDKSQLELAVIKRKLINPYDSFSFTCV
ncbi:hypothetical protein GOV12_08295 [Candidatus Pacearchaeota archaeon]|nr:hypothetical protein [Candidatus Pacearchaeota archaeon]